MEDFSHPYIDKELDDPAIRKIVDAMVRAEMLPTENEPVPIPDPELLELPEYVPSPEARLEDLYIRKTLLESAIGQGSFGRSEIGDLERRISNLHQEKVALREEIDHVIGLRVTTQEGESGRLCRLQQKAAMLEDSIDRLNRAISEHTQGSAP